MSGAPGAGKTVYARALAVREGACFLDSDSVADRLVRAGLSLANMGADDRDSLAYKNAFRDPVYETLFDLAIENLANLTVVIAGPFTRESGEIDWPDRLFKRLGVAPNLHYIWCRDDQRKKRIQDRGERRDVSKLEDWDNHLHQTRKEPPVWNHFFVDTTDYSIDDNENS